MFNSIATEHPVYPHVQDPTETDSSSEERPDLPPKAPEEETDDTDVKIVTNKNTEEALESLDPKHTSLHLRAATVVGIPKISWYTDFFQNSVFLEANGGALLYI